MLGRVVRATVPIAAYGSALSAAAALWLLIIAILLGVPLVGFAPSTWWVFIGLALGPHLCGHIGFNFALRYRPASVVGAVTLLEPVGAAVLAAWLLHEVPSARDVFASGIVLVGVYLAMARSSAPLKEAND
jgi:drug/metabolite transporter (DMT)-like permease